jgi:hypothetical protein
MYPAHRLIALFSLLLLAPLLWPGLACAEQDKRVALVIGNAAYGVGPLRNPVNDARDMAEKLRELGFPRENIVYRENLKLREIAPMLREFRSKLDRNTVAVVYYAGHGLQLNGENFLPTVDARIAREEDVQLNSLRLRHIIELMGASGIRMSLIFLDACRATPFASGSNAVAGGLAREQLPSGSLLSYATRPGDVAADGEGRNGTYTAELLRHIGEPGLTVEQMLKRVVSGVRRSTKGRQDPWMEGSIEGDFYFRPVAPALAGSAAPPLAADVARPAGAAPAGGPSPMGMPTPAATSPAAAASAQALKPPGAEEIEQIYWNTIQGSQDPRDFRDYLARWPAGLFVPLAQRQLRVLESTDNRKAPTITRISIDLLTRQRRELTEMLQVAADGSSSIGADRFFPSGHPRMLAEPDTAFLGFVHDGVVMRDGARAGDRWEGATTLLVNGFEVPAVRYTSVVSRRLGQPDPVLTISTRFSGSYRARNSSFEILCTLELVTEMEFDTSTRRMVRSEVRHDRITPTCPRGGLQVSYVTGS